MQTLSHRPDRQKPAMQAARQGSLPASLRSGTCPQGRFLQAKSAVAKFAHAR